MVGCSNSFKIKSVKTMATARTERDSSRKVWRTPLKHFCILTSQVPYRSFQGSCLVHTVAFLEKFVLFPSDNHKVPPHGFSNGSCKKTGKELQQATTATRLFYKLAQRAPPLSPDVRGPIVHPLRLLSLDFFFFFGRVSSPFSVLFFSFFYDKST